MTIGASLLMLWVVLAVVTGWYSVALIMHQIHGHLGLFLMILGTVELAGAILFLIPGTVHWGGIGLLIAIGVAALFHLLHGQYDVGCQAVYCAAVLAVISGENRR